MIPRIALDTTLELDLRAIQVQIRQPLKFLILFWCHITIHAYGIIIIRICHDAQTRIILSLPISMLISHVFVYTVILYLVGQLFILHREHHVSGVRSVLLVALAQGLIVISALELGERGAHLNVIILLSLLNVTATTFNT